MGRCAFASRQFAPNAGPLSGSFTLLCPMIFLVFASVAGGSRPRSEAPCLHIEKIYHAGKGAFYTDFFKKFRSCVGISYFLSYLPTYFSLTDPPKPSRLRHDRRRVKTCGVKPAAGEKNRGKTRLKTFVFSAFLCLECLTTIRHFP